MTARTFQAVDPVRGALFEPGFAAATDADVARACRLADAASDTFRETAPEQRARFLEAIGDRVEALGDALLARALAETASPLARLTTERARTTGQLRLFARVLREGHWAGVTLDPPLPHWVDSRGYRPANIDCLSHLPRSASARKLSVIDPDDGASDCFRGGRTKIKQRIFELARLI